MSALKIRVILDPKMEDMDHFDASIKFLDSMLSSINLVRDQEVIANLQYSSFGYHKSTILEKINGDIHKDSPVIFITRGRVYNDANDSYNQNMKILSFYEIRGKSTNLGNLAIKQLFKLISETYPQQICDAESLYFNNTDNFPYLTENFLTRQNILPLGNVVMSIPGMNTEGIWEKNLATYLNKQNWKHFNGDYGKFYKIMCPSARNYLRDGIILNKYQDLLSTYPKNQWRHHIIAHSFGTYLFVDMLLTHSVTSYPESILFIASILSPTINLTKIIENGTRIICECAGRDIIVKAAPALRLTGAAIVGLSGVKGFLSPPETILNIKDTGMTYDEFVDKLQKNSDKRIINIFYPYKKHSEFFVDNHFENRWLPLLQSGFHFSKLGKPA